MSDPVQVNMQSVPLFEVPEYTTTNPTKPTYASVREIDFKFDSTGKELIFYFTRADFRVLVNNEEHLKQILIAVRDNRFDYDDDEDKEPKEPYDNTISVENKHHKYIIYRLSRAKNWQFASEFAPISLGAEAALSDKYREARRLDADGNLERVKDKKPAKDGCIVACFIADNRNSGNFKHSINLHVDLLQEGGRRRLPIVVDPDIRHPGGSGPDA